MQIAEKRCGRCGEVKSTDEFHKGSRPGRFYSYCKACAKVRNAAYYRATPEKNAQRQASRDRMRDSARKFVWEYLLDHPCVDCGEGNPVVLQFDHLRDKVQSISVMVTRGWSIEKIALEIEKCEVRCANCHLIVTATRGGWWTPES